MRVRALLGRDVSAEAHGHDGRAVWLGCDLLGLRLAAAWDVSAQMFREAQARAAQAQQKERSA